MGNAGTVIIGTGFMGAVHVEALKRIGIPVVGILGSTKQKSEQFAETHQIGQAYGAMEEVLQDSTVNAVHLCTPNRFHYETAKEALSHGKHVMCEKPLAMTPQESAELVEISRRKPELAAGVNYNMRFYPLCIEASQRVETGQVGDVFHIQGGYVQDWLLRETDYNWRVLSDQGGELRAISDIGTHWLDLVQHVTGLEVTSICADLYTVHPERRRPLGEVQTFKQDENQGTEPVAITTEDYGAVLLRFNNGARGSLVVSQVTAGRKNCLRFEIAGSECSLAFDSESPNELFVGRRDQANGLLLKDPSLASQQAANCMSYPGGHNEGYADTFKQCFRAFYGSIGLTDSDGPTAYPTFADGHREILLCDAIARSHRERRWVELEKDTET